jgi:hypothetical protein
VILFAVYTAASVVSLILIKSWILAARTAAAGGALVSLPVAMVVLGAGLYVVAFLSWMVMGGDRAVVAAAQQARPRTTQLPANRNNSRVNQTGVVSDNFGRRLTKKWSAPRTSGRSGPCRGAASATPGMPAKRLSSSFPSRRQLGRSSKNRPPMNH